MKHFHGTINEIFANAADEYGKTNFNITVTFCEDSEVVSTSHFRDIEDAAMLLASNVLDFYADADVDNDCNMMRILVNF